MTSVFVLFRTQIFSYQPDHLTRLGVTMGCKLGVEQFIINRDLESPSVGRHQGDRFDLRLKFFEQLSCQTDSTIGVVSDRAIDQIDFQHTIASNRLNNTPAGDATGVKKPASLFRYGIPQRYLLPS
jgi:hypothetical protein